MATKEPDFKQILEDNETKIANAFRRSGLLPHEWRQMTEKLKLGATRFWYYSQPKPATKKKD